MLVRDGENYLELIVAERCTVVHGLGDTQFAARVRVSSMFAEFSAESPHRVDLPALVREFSALAVATDADSGVPADPAPRAGPGR